MAFPKKNVFEQFSTRPTRLKCANLIFIVVSRSLIVCWTSVQDYLHVASARIPVPSWDLPPKFPNSWQHLPPPGLVE